MKAGRYRQFITIERLEHGIPDPATGHGKKGWVPIFPFKIQAEVLEGPGREPFMLGTIQADTTARINIRWFDIDKADLMRCRILWDGQVFGIISAERDASGRRQWRLRCSDGVNDG